MTLKTVTLRVERVSNGWIIFGYSMRQHDGYLPDDTNVATTPDELARIMREWASSQESK